MLREQEREQEFGLRPSKSSVFQDILQDLVRLLHRPMVLSPVKSKVPILLDRDPAESQ